MTAFAPLIGKRFGSLVVVDESERAEPGKLRKVQVRCDCGNVEMVSAQRTRNGKYTACGQCKPRFDSTFMPMLGQRFGKLVVIDESEIGTKRGVVCRCDCGVEKRIIVGSLRSGRSTTCGSCNRSIDRLKSVVGQAFGKLTVIDEPEIKRNRRVTCRCECGRVVVRLLSNLKRGQTKSCGCTKWYDHDSGYIYYLFDPIDMALRYIGQSVQSPGVRLSGHLYGVKSRGRKVDCTAKKDWINGLKPYRPAIWIAERDIAVDTLDEREQWHIAQAIERGESLLNIHHAKVKS